MSADATPDIDMDDVVLPDGVDPDDVEFDDERPEVMAYDMSAKYPYDDAAFDPRNGRWYKRYGEGQGIFDFDSTETTVGHICDCSYRGCGGTWTVERRMEAPTRACPDCGAPRMGRAQFSDDADRRRSDRRAIRKRTTALSDEFASEMKRLTDAGVGPAAAMDYLMCSVGDTPAHEWATARGVNERSVRRNMKRVANALGETVRWTA